MRSLKFPVLMMVVLAALTGGCQAPAPVQPAQAQAPVAEASGLERMLVPLGEAGEARLPLEVASGYAEQVRLTEAGEAELLNGYGQQVFRAAEGAPWSGLVPAGSYTLVLKGARQAEVLVRREAGALVIGAPPVARDGADDEREARDRFRWAMHQAHYQLPASIYRDGLMQRFRDMIATGPIAGMRRDHLHVPAVLWCLQQIVKEAPDTRMTAEAIYYQFRVVAGKAVTTQLPPTL